MKHNTHLLQNLTEYSQSDFYPFHMPGHKRKHLDFPNPWSIDITEIEGFDNLHHPEGILKKLQEKAASIFHSEKSFCLVNGSTCGLLAAISACVKSGGKLLMSRNCHKSVYHGVYLRNITPVYLMPEMTEFGIMGSLSPEKVQQALEEHSDIDAILVVSPTYDGVVSDIQSIADLAHKHNIPLIVDEAHGAHFPLSSDFPASALSCGADVVIQSLHKTLPAFTQTALLHLNSKLVSEDEIRRFLGIYQSSSPSYLLMASIDKCMEIIQSHGKKLLKKLKDNLETFYRNCSTLQNVQVFQGEPKNVPAFFDWDNSKILISAQKLGLSGQDLAKLLREKYHLEPEMASGHYVLALSSLMDTPEGFERLFEALAEIDRMEPLSFSSKNADIINDRKLYYLPKQEMSIAQALERDFSTVPLTEALGKISREFLYLYPPGIPLLAPGERIDDTLLKNIQHILQLGLQPEGLADMTNQRINIVNS